VGVGKRGSGNLWRLLRAIFALPSINLSSAPSWKCFTSSCDKTELKPSS
jgi:hypothetical protein